MTGPLPRAAKSLVHTALHGLGIDIIRYSPAHFVELRRKRLIARNACDLVLDVGANAGQYAHALRRHGYGGRIVSFEPVSESFEKLARAADGDPLWTCFQLALGDTDGTVPINVSENTWSSSILPIEPRHVANAPAAAYVRTEDVTVAQLDSVAPELVGECTRALLKLDVQGYELTVLRGAERSLGCVVLVEAEVSFLPLYSGQPLFAEVVSYLSERGYGLVWLEPASVDERSGHLVQGDALFERRDAPQPSREQPGSRVGSA